MKARFNNLACEGDWQKLFDHLLMKSGWMTGVYDKMLPKRILNQVFGGELVNGTILLFQSLCPVRFGFLDGQSRMVSMHYYIRKLVPTTESGKPGAISKVMSEFRPRQHWTLEKGGNDASCIIIIPSPEEFGKPATTKYVWYLRELSKIWLDKLMDRLENLSSMTPSNFGDVVLRLLSNIKTNMDSFGPPYIIANLTGKVKARIKDIFMWMLKEEEDVFFRLYGHDKTTDEDAYKRLFKTSRVFPSLSGQRKEGGYELLVLLPVLAALSSNHKMILYLEDCVNKEWIVPVLQDGEVCGVNCSDLHQGTYVCYGKGDNYFLSRYYAVSTALEIKHKAL